MTTRTVEVGPLQVPAECHISTADHVVRNYLRTVSRYEEDSALAPLMAQALETAFYQLYFTDAPETFVVLRIIKEPLE